jgi:selenocysteine lyase/cysteine desulfurase
VSAGFGPVVRASLSIFNTEDEVGYFVESMKKVREDMGL